MQLIHQQIMHILNEPKAKANTNKREINCSNSQHHLTFHFHMSVISPCRLQGMETSIILTLLGVQLLLPVGKNTRFSPSALVLQLFQLVFTHYLLRNCLATTVCGNITPDEDPVGVETLFIIIHANNVFDFWEHQPVCRSLSFLNYCD